MKCLTALSQINSTCHAAGRSFPTQIAALLLLAPLATTALAAPVHVWGRREITLCAAKVYANPYTEAQIWVDRLNWK